MSETTIRSLSVIAREIEGDWKQVNYAARPYLDALHQLDSIEDAFFLDSAKSVVLYFLANAQTWRGDVARRVKKELKSLANV